MTHRRAVEFALAEMRRAERRAKRNGGTMKHHPTTRMRKVQVSVDDHTLTYEAPSDVQVGDRVLLPANRWRDRTWATVHTLGSDYDGYLVKVLAVERAGMVQQVR